jgi:hypothetical protein
MQRRIPSDRSLTKGRIDAFTMADIHRAGCSSLRGAWTDTDIVPTQENSLGNMYGSSAGAEDNCPWISMRLDGLSKRTAAGLIGPRAGVSGILGPGE